MSFSQDQIMARPVLPLYGLQVFEVAARTLSFTRAAEELFITQSAVSKQISQLEAQLGYPLFHRQVRKLTLSVQGEVLLPHVTRALSMLAKGLEAAGRSVKNRLRLKAPSCASRWLLGEVREFAREYPEIEVEVTSVHAHDVNFSREPFDLAVVFVPLPSANPNLTPLFIEQLTPVLTPGLAEQVGVPLTEPAALTHYPLLHPSRDKRDWSQWLAAVGAGEIGVASGQIFETLDQAMSAALQGFGVSIADVTLLKDELARGAVVAPFDQLLLTGCGYALARPPADKASDAALLMHDWLLERHRVAPEAMRSGLVSLTLG